MLYPNGFPIVDSNLATGSTHRQEAEPPGPLAPVYAGAYAHAWTLFDLRPLRSNFLSIGPLDRELERLIFGYDLLIVIPEVSAQNGIH